MGWFPLRQGKIAAHSNLGVVCKRYRYHCLTLVKCTHQIILEVFLKMTYLQVKAVLILPAVETQ